MIETKIDLLIEEIHQKTYAQNESIIEIMLENFYCIFKKSPQLEFRWRVWALGLNEQLLFDRLYLDIKTPEDKHWYALKCMNSWTALSAKSVDFTECRTGKSNAQHYKDLNLIANYAEIRDFCYNVGIMASLYNLSQYGNLTCFNKALNPHPMYSTWDLIPSKKVTNKSYSDNPEEDGFLCSIINKDNYLEAVTCIHIDHKFVEKIRAEFPIKALKIELNEQTPSGQNKLSKQKI